MYRRDLGRAAETC